jgi:hypothetical protein
MERKMVSSFYQSGLKANEERYFQQKNKELLDKLKREEKAMEDRVHLSRMLNTQKDHLTEEAALLGFSPETVRLVWLVPLVYVAWSDHGISDSEKSFIKRFAEMHGMLSNQESNDLLDRWLKNPPPADFFDRCHSLIFRLYQGISRQKALELQSRLQHGCASVAESDGGFLGFGGRTSREEASSISQLEEIGLFGNVD